MNQFIPRFPTAWNAEVTPCLIIVDQAGLSNAYFQHTFELLQKELMKHEDNSKLRIGMIDVSNTVNPKKPEDIQFLALMDWKIRQFDVIERSENYGRTLPKAILSGLWGIRVFRDNLRSHGVRVMPPLVYVFTRALPHEDDITSEIANYTKKTTQKRRLALKWFYMPDDAESTSTTALETFVANPEQDITIIREGDVQNGDDIRAHIVRLVSQSISSSMASFSLPHPNQDTPDEEDELEKLMKQEKFRP